MKNKLGPIFVFLILIGIIGLFVFMFINSIKLYLYYDITYNDLKYEKLHFEKVEVIERHRGSDIYEIYFLEYDTPFQVTGIADEKINKNNINNLRKNEVCKVYYRKSTSKNYDYAIYEMECKTSIILDLDESIEVNRKNQKFGMILCPILIVCVLSLMGFYIYFIYSEYKLNKFMIE